MKILVTGGAGYIGSHTCVELIDAGYEIVVVDNLSNSKPQVVDRIGEITGRRPPLIQLDLRDESALNALFEQQHFDAVVHFAGLKAVGESTRQPLDYYDNNVCGTLTLCRAMACAGIFRIVFSSSATVYGDPAQVPIREDFPTAPTNPYGHTKLVVEGVLDDLYRSDPRWSIAVLRYFNPVGAHPSGQIGEDPNGIPNNLMPYITQVAVGRLEILSVFGDDYDTVDGTGVRDYIHVVDLARGHIAALERLAREPGHLVCNLGTGRGYSVLEVVAAFERASGREIPYRVTARRPGDVAKCYADPTRALDQLGWRARYGIDEMVRDSWNWQSMHPNGYGEADTDS